MNRKRTHTMATLGKRRIGESLSAFMFTNDQHSYQSSSYSKADAGEESDLKSSKNDIATFFIGSVLSGGGGGPNGVGGTATQWADMVDNLQSHTLQTRLGIPILYGADAVHGHNNVFGAT